jgi:hypothetical protein
MFEMMIVGGWVFVGVLCLVLAVIVVRMLNG